MKQTQPKFQAGDRVAERPKATYIPGLSAASKAAIAKYREQRYGTVESTFTKQTKGRDGRGSTHQYVRVLWDGKQTPSEHAQHRLIAEDELAALLETYVEAIGG